MIPLRTINPHSIDNLSASRFKCFNECELKYIYTYHPEFKLPRESNLGARTGSVVHEIYENMFLTNSIENFNHLITPACKANFIDGDFTKTAIKKVVKHCNTLKKMDYYGHPETTYGVEVKIDLTLKDGVTKVLGFIDKLNIVGQTATVIDIKTQKKLFTQGELDDNIQSMIYTMAVKRMFPHLKTITVEFWQSAHEVIQYCDHYEYIDATEELLIDTKKEIESCIDPQPCKNQYCRWCPVYKNKKCPIHTYPNTVDQSDLIAQINKMKGGLDGVKI